jgi:hypothetical protein
MILPVGRVGDGSALVVFLASIRCSVWGHSGPHPGRLDVHIAPAVGATSFDLRPVAIGHTAGAISAAPQEVAVAAQLQGWMLAWGISGACQITSEHSWIDGGDCGEGRAVSLVAGPIAPRLAALVHQRKPCSQNGLLPIGRKRLFSTTYIARCRCRRRWRSARRTRRRIWQAVRRRWRAGAPPRLRSAPSSSPASRR